MPAIKARTLPELGNLQADFRVSRDRRRVSFLLDIVEFSEKTGRNSGKSLWSQLWTARYQRKGFPTDNGVGAPFGERHQVDGGLHGLLRRGVLHQATWAWRKRWRSSEGRDKYMAVCRSCYSKEDTSRKEES
uniref:Putative thymidine kinase n=1 Tax=Ixodes ricinus TaxID=34613 RepID=A0A090X7P4_IXORI